MVKNQVTDSTSTKKEQYERVNVPANEIHPYDPIKLVAFAD